jgi:hypothetical protein
LKSFDRRELFADARGESDKVTVAPQIKRIKITPIDERSGLHGISKQCAAECRQASSSRRWHMTAIYLASPG